MSGQFPMYPGMYGQDDQEPYAYGMNVPQPQAMNLNGRSQLLPNIQPSLLSPQLANRNNDLPQYADGGSVGMPASYGAMNRMPYHRPRMNVDPYNSPIHFASDNMANGGMQTGGYKPTPEQAQVSNGVIDRMPFHPQSSYLPQYAGGGSVDNKTGLAGIAELFSADLIKELQKQYGGGEGAQQYVQPKYKKGGHASLRKNAKRIRAQGTDGDTVLAHISPLEAAQLAKQSGGPTINPKTGLPSYKFRLKKILKTAAKIAAPFIGGAIAGPAGAAIGGGLAGVIGGGKNKLTKGLIGAGLGYAGAGGFGNLGGVGNVIPKVNNAVGLTGLAGKLGMGGAGLGTLGAVGAANAAVPMVAAKNMQQAAAAPETSGNDFFSGFNAGNLLPLAGMGILATQAKKKYPNEGNISEMLKREKPEWSADQQHRKMKAIKRALRSIGAEEYLQPGAPELEYFEDTNPEAESYSHGGLVHYMANGGHLDGYSGGQDDTIEARLSDGEFVLPADIVSSLGDGNNNAGAKKLDVFMRSVRTHKTSKGAKGLPPKAKTMAAYMKARGKR